jgi:hypothetical protein
MTAGLKQLSLPAVQAALKAGADPNQPNAQGNTPLLYIAREGAWVEALALAAVSSRAPHALVPAPGCFSHPAACLPLCPPLCCVAWLRLVWRRPLLRPLQGVLCAEWCGTRPP